MCAFQLFLSVDPSLGRVDYRLFSDQTLMEMLTEGFDDETKKKYRENDGMYLDVCKWSCVTCDDDERVIQIQIDSINVSGSVELRYVPPKAKALEITSPTAGKLTGSVDLTQLPGEMWQLNLHSNNLSGELDLTQLPNSMRDVYLYNNQFTGEIDLTHLPVGMKGLYLYKNRLSGEIDLAHLPNGMHYLNLGHNHLTGSIDLTQLPDEMDVLQFHNNQLSGSLVIKCLPSGINTILAGGNNFNAIALVDSKSHVFIKLRGSGVTAVVDKNGKEVNIKRFLY